MKYRSITVMRHGDVVRQWSNWILTKYWAMCASNCIVLGRVQSCRLVYTITRPSLCEHSITWRRTGNISCIAYIRSVRAIHYLIKISLELCVFYYTKSGYLPISNTPPEQKLNIFLHLIVLGKGRLGKISIGKSPLGNDHRGEYSAWEDAQLGKILLG